MRSWIEKIQPKSWLVELLPLAPPPLATQSTIAGHRMLMFTAGLLYQIGYAAVTNSPNISMA